MYRFNNHMEYRSHKIKSNFLRNFKNSITEKMNKFELNWYKISDSEKVVDLKIF